METSRGNGLEVKELSSLKTARILDARKISDKQFEEVIDRMRPLSNRIIGFIAKKISLE